MFHGGTTVDEGAVPRPSPLPLPPLSILRWLLEWCAKGSVAVYASACLGELIVVALCSPLSPLLQLEPWLNQFTATTIMLVVVAFVTTTDSMVARFGPVRGFLAHVTASLLALGLYWVAASELGMLIYPPPLPPIQQLNQSWGLRRTESLIQSTRRARDQWLLALVPPFAAGAVYLFVLWNLLVLGGYGVKTSSFGHAVVKQIMCGFDWEGQLLLASFYTSFAFIALSAVTIACLRLGQSHWLVVNLIVAAVGMPLGKVLVRKVAAKYCFEGWAKSQIVHRIFWATLLPFSSQCTEIVGEVLAKYLLFRTCMPETTGELFRAVEAARLQGRVRVFPATGTSGSLEAELERSPWLTDDYAFFKYTGTVRPGLFYATNMFATTTTLRARAADGRPLGAEAATAAAAEAKRASASWFNSSNPLNSSMLGNRSSLLGTPMAVAAVGSRPQRATTPDMSYFLAALLVHVVLDVTCRLLYVKMLHPGKRIRIAKR